MQEAFQIGEGVYPAGALTPAAQGKDPGEDSWVRADPVHLRVIDDGSSWCRPRRLRCAPRSWRAVRGAERPLRGHGIHRVAAAALVREAREASMKAVLRSMQPARRSSCPSRAPLLTEIQMDQHAHPVNEAREARGEPAVNSVWLWGSGRAPRARAPWQSVAADDPAVLGAARLANARQRALPRSAREWLERLPEDGRHLAVLDALRAPLALAPDTVRTRGGRARARLVRAASGRSARRAHRNADAACARRRQALSFEIMPRDLRRLAAAASRSRTTHENRRAPLRGSEPPRAARGGDASRCSRASTPAGTSAPAVDIPARIIAAARSLKGSMWLRACSPTPSRNRSVCSSSRTTMPTARPRAR